VIPVDNPKVAGTPDVTPVAQLDAAMASDTAVTVVSPITTA